MNKPKLIYFDFPGGRGEDCRLALHVAGVDFEDDRVAFAAWKGRKASAPFGALPVFELPGKGMVGGSNAILRLIGSGHDLHPTDPVTAAQHEAVMSSVEDVRARVNPNPAIEDEAEKKAFREALADGYLRTWAANVEAQIQGPFLGGDKLQVVDLKLRTLVTWFCRGGVDHVSKDVFSEFPKLTALVEAVQNHPRVVDWYSRG
ncbi:MAG: glutathione S-transferase family protein [Nannocystales bacterium]